MFWRTVKDDAVVIIVQNGGGIGYAVLYLSHHGAYRLQIWVLTVPADKLVRDGVVAALGTDKAVIGENHQLILLGENISAHNQPGVILQAKQIGQRWHNVQTGAVLVHIDGLLHIGAP